MNAPSLIFAALAATLAALPAQAEEPMPGTGLSVVKSAHGAHLADAGGRAVYLFSADTRGEGMTMAVSHCEDDCVAAWPPVLTHAAPMAGEGVQSEMLGQVKRSDGVMQVTYGGWPLYYFIKDQGPGQTEGFDREGFGGEWYLVTPAGEKLEH